MRAAVRSLAAAVLATATLLPLAARADTARTDSGIAVPNGSFEQADAAAAPKDWTVSGRGSATTTTADAHGGGHSLQVVNSGGISVRSAHLPARQNDRLVAHAWERGSDGDPAWLYLEFWTASGQRIAERHVLPATGNSWRPVQIGLAAPPLTAYATVLVYGSTTQSGTSYYDSVSLAKEPGEQYSEKLGNSTELFVDDYRVDSTSGISRVVHPGAKSDVLLAPDQPWEGKVAYLYGTVLWDPELKLYRMWYTTFDADGAEFACYATSRDGITWTKPDLGLVDYHGSTQNNIVLATGPGADLAGVIRDPDDPDPNKRFKLLIYQGDPKGYNAYFSPDGLHWTAYSQNPVIEGADVANVSYDRARGRFIATTKQPFGSRAAFTSVSTDFVHWTTPELALAADDRDRQLAVEHGGVDAQICGMPAMPYGNTYLAFPWIFEITGDGEPGTAGAGAVQAQIAASRDLLHWGRPDRDPIIPVGPEGAWDDGMTFTANDLIVGDRTVTMYYSGWDGNHGVKDRGAKIAKVTWRRDGFVSLSNGGGTDGVVTTKPITFTGSALHVNAAVRSGGRLQVEVLDAAGKHSLLKSGDVTGDRIDTAVAWRSGDLGSLAGKRVRLRFHLRDGDLYSFRISGGGR
ncbi:MAG TPA: hypothetical protein VHC49_26905 [Mycobacteriales bacterium]|nr:hypothetical protein [Mycobacteriales bacterium]